MIKIEELDGFDGVKRKLADLEKPYFERVCHKGFKSRAKSPLQKLKSLLKKRRNVRRQIIKYCIDNFENILLSKPDQLFGFIQHFEQQGWNNVLDSDKDFGLKLATAFSYQNHFRSVDFKGLWLAQQLNIKTCPYCNAQYTLNVQHKTKGVLAKFQFDHFFSKDKYPYLSISLYNLVPSCAICNLSKGNKPTRLNTHYHPYVGSIYDKFIFNIDSETAIEKLVLNDISKSKLTIQIKYEDNDREFVEEHDRIFNLKGIYQNHADVAEEILMKAQMYPELKREELIEMHGLFDDEATFYRYFLGNYHLEEDSLKRPLAKFTRDIAKQIKLID